MPEGSSAQRIPGYCALCRSRCGCVSVVENGRLVAVEADPRHPTGSALCIKGKAASELVYSADRLLHPLKRTRPKTDPDPGWQRIGWDEALATSARELNRLRQQGGAESVAFGVTTPSATACRTASCGSSVSSTPSAAELGLCHRAVQLAQGSRARLHVRRRRHGTRFPPYRLRAAVGP
ncbi:MAG: molybdopterin-dependent oxidoreductase [Pseudomonadota bacterium]